MAEAEAAAVAAIPQTKGREKPEKKRTKSAVAPKKGKKVMGDRKISKLQDDVHKAKKENAISSEMQEKICSWILIPQNRAELSARYFVMREQGFNEMKAFIMELSKEFVDKTTCEQSNDKVKVLAKVVFLKVRGKASASLSYAYTDNGLRREIFEAARERTIDVLKLKEELSMKLTNC